MSKIITVLAGEFVHQTTTQFRWLAARAPEGLTFRIIEGPEAFEQLGDTDLLIVAGLYWTGSPTVTWTTQVPYTPPNEVQKQGLRAYSASGRPILAFHGGIASFDDWPEFGKLLGYGWHWSITTHGPRKEYRVYPQGDHPTVAGVSEFQIVDENYYNVQIQPGASYATHLKMDCGDLQLPMLLTCDGKHVSGAGRSAYLALGHDMNAVENPAFLPVFQNTLDWLLSTEP